MNDPDGRQGAARYLPDGQQERRATEEWERQKDVERETWGSSLGRSMIGGLSAAAVAASVVAIVSLVAFLVWLLA